MNVLAPKRTVQKGQRVVMTLHRSAQAWDLALSRLRLQSDLLESYDSRPKSGSLMRRVTASRLSTTK